MIDSLSMCVCLFFLSLSLSASASASLPIGLPLFALEKRRYLMSSRCLFASSSSQTDQPQDSVSPTGRRFECTSVTDYSLSITVAQKAANTHTLAELETQFLHHPLGLQTSYVVLAISPLLAL